MAGVVNLVDRHVGFSGGGEGVFEGGDVGEGGFLSLLPKMPRTGPWRFSARVGSLRSGP